MPNEDVPVTLVDAKIPDTHLLITLKWLLLVKVVVTCGLRFLQKRISGQALWKIEAQARINPVNPAAPSVCPKNDLLEANVRYCDESL